jgi:ABC-2 type transport system ATP-binding protein
VVGVLDFEEGDIEIDGISIKKDPVACKRVTAYIPDNPDLYDHLTGIQYLNFIGDLYSVSRADRELLIQKYGDAFQITDSLGNLISSYSHGMKQKLAIISALIHRPKLLVLDEPFVGLDPQAAHTLKTIMADLCRNGSAIFFSTHVLDVAEKLCNKIAIIKAGQLITHGRTEDVKGDHSLEDVFLELIDK